MFVGFLN